MYDGAFLWIHLTAYYFCNKSSIIDVQLGLRKYWNFHSEAKLEQIIAIVTTRFLVYTQKKKNRKKKIFYKIYRNNPS